MEVADTLVTLVHNFGQKSFVIGVNKAYRSSNHSRIYHTGVLGEHLRALNAKEPLAYKSNNTPNQEKLRVLATRTHSNVLKRSSSVFLACLTSAKL